MSCQPKDKENISGYSKRSSGAQEYLAALLSSPFRPKNLFSLVILNNSGSFYHFKSYRLQVEIFEWYWWQKYWQENSSCKICNSLLFHLYGVEQRERN